MGEDGEGRVEGAVREWRKGGVGGRGVEGVEGGESRLGSSIS